MTAVMATNSVGWEIQEFAMPEGWVRSIKFPGVFSSHHRAMVELCESELEQPELFRVYQALA